MDNLVLDPVWEKGSDQQAFYEGSWIRNFYRIIRDPPISLLTFGPLEDGPKGTVIFQMAEMQKLIRWKTVKLSKEKGHVYGDKIWKQIVRAFIGAAIKLYYYF